MFEPHLRLSWTGDLPGGEMFSCSVSLVPDNNTWAAAVTAVAKIAILTNVLTDVNLTDDLVTDVTNYHSRETTGISPLCKVRRVKIAALDEDGHYIGAPKEAAVNIAGGGGNATMPNQISRKVTLLTNGDLGRVKGGWYLPGVSSAYYDVATQLFDTGSTAGLQASTLTFLQDLENAPGLDANSFLVAVASQGRHNKDGSLRTPARNHDVVGVSVGRRADVQRRRANKVSEARIAALSLS